MSSNIEIIKRCGWCGKEFVARKTSTEYCSHRCSGLAYKERKRQQKLEAFKIEYVKSSDEVTEIEKLEFLSPTQLCQLLGLGLYHLCGSTSRRRRFRLWILLSVESEQPTYRNRMALPQRADTLQERKRTSTTIESRKGFLHRNDP